MMNAGHRACEKKFSHSDFFCKVLEIGAGTGAHLPFVNHPFDQCILTGVNTSTLEVARQKKSIRIKIKLAMKYNKLKT